MTDSRAPSASSGEPLPAPRSLNDPGRLDVLRRSELLDGASNQALDRLTRIASALLNVPISLVSLVDNAGQHFPGLTGLDGWAGERRGTALSHSFCQHVVTRNAPLIIENSRQSALVADNLAIPRLGVLSYAGVPLRTADGHTLGALCAIDGQPKGWTADEMSILEDLARLAVAEIEEQLARGVAPSLPAEPDTVDTLTGVLNGRGFQRRGEELTTTSVTDAGGYSVVTVDVDGFAAYNAQFGYDAGNARLVDVARALQEVDGPTRTVARLGVDEFGVLLPHTDSAGAVQFITRLHEFLQRRSSEHGSAPLTVSAGYSTADGVSSVVFAHVLQRAEIAMYEHMGVRLRCTLANAG